MLKCRVTELSSSEVVVNRSDRKQMARSGFGRVFHDLDYFGLKFFSIFLEFLIHVRSSSNSFVENYQLNVILIIFQTKI